MKYIVLSTNGAAQEVLLNEDPIFPGILLTERYSEEFLSHCKKVADDYEVIIGWLWDEGSKTFVEPPEPEPVDPPDEPEPDPIDPPVNPDVPSNLENRVIELEAAFDALSKGLVDDE